MTMFKIHQNKDKQKPTQWRVMQWN